MAVGIYLQLAESSPLVSSTGELISRTSFQNPSDVSVAIFIRQSVTFVFASGNVPHFLALHGLTASSEIWLIVSIVIVT